MTAKKVEKAQKPKKRGPPTSSSPPKALPRGTKTVNTGQPGGGQGRVDITGIMPEGIRVDPNVTEGHPGYEESGDSEIIPTERLTEGGAVKEKESR